MNKRRFPGCLVVLCAIVLLLIGGYFTMKHGYCRSWWGKDSMVMRSLWLCDCSREFEQSLYPSSTTILFSACEAKSEDIRYFGIGPVFGRRALTPGVLGTPSSDWIAIQLGNADSQVQLLNLYSGEHISLDRSIAAWLTNDLIWIYQGRNQFLYSLDSRAEIPIRDIRTVRPDLIEDNHVTAEGIEVLRTTYDIIVVHPSIVALGPDYWKYPEHNFWLGGNDLLDGYDEDVLMSFLTQQRIPFSKGYSKNNQPLPSGETIIASPDRRFLAKTDGIYNATTLEKVLDYDIHLPGLGRFSGYGPCCWRSDGKELILHVGKNPQITGRPFTFLDFRQN